MLRYKATTYHIRSEGKQSRTKESGLSFLLTKEERRHLITVSKQISFGSECKTTAFYKDGELVVTIVPKYANRS